MLIWEYLEDLNSTLYSDLSADRTFLKLHVRGWTSQEYLSKKAGKVYIPGFQSIALA